VIKETDQAAVDYVNKGVGIMNLDQQNARALAGPMT
jgi:hypothetical protein